MKKIFLIAILSVFAVLNSFSQGNSPKNENSPPPKEEFSNSIPKDLVKDSNWGFLTSLEFILSVSVLFFGILIIMFELHLIKKNQINQEYAVKFIIITLIIISTLFLITAGYNNNQIAPATGLLGTIAGYLLGKSNSNKKDE